MKLNAFEKIAKMLAKEHRISIENGDSWAANIKNRKVFYRKEDIYNLSEDHILGLLLHEIGHIHYTTDTVQPKDNKELSHTVLNMIEDISIENIIGKDYPNAGEILQSTKQEVLDSLLKILPKIKISKHEKSILFAATRFEGRGYSSGLEDYEKLGEEINTILERERTTIMTRKETATLLPMVNEIVNLIIGKLGAPNEQERQQMKENANSGDAMERDSQGQIQKKVLGQLKAGKGWKEGPELNQRVSFIDQIADQAAMIGKRLRSVLKRNNAMEFAGRFRTGKLLARRLSRIKILKDRNPFARRIVKSNQSYAFAIASDVSGSMFESAVSAKTNGSYALSSMYMVGEALRLAGIPRSMTIFGYRVNTVSPMGKNPITFEQLGNDKDIRKAHQGGTEIGLAMEECIKQLANVKAERKIMIILTDGQSDLYAMKEAHREAIKMGIEPLGITIGHYGASEMEETFGKGKNRIITDTTNKQLIGAAFIDILKESVKKSS